MEQHKLSNLASEYLEHLEKLCKRRERSWSTYDLTKRTFKYLIDAVGDIDLDFFNKEKAEKFKEWLQDKEEIDSNTSVNIYLKAVRKPFRWAIDRRRWIKEDVFNIPLLRPNKSQKRIFTPSEFYAMLTVAPNEMWRGRLWCLYTLGMRMSEVMHLTDSDINYSKGLVHVQPKKETHKTLAWEPKDKECRTLPALDDFLKICLRVRKENIPGQSYLFITSERYNRIMLNRKMGILSTRTRIHLDQNINRPWRKILKKAKIAPYGPPKSMRQSYLTLLAEDGLPEHWAQRLAGHSDSETTREYYLAIRESKMFDDVRQRLSRIIGVAGFDPATSRPPDERSTELSYTPNNNSHSAHFA